MKAHNQIWTQYLSQQQRLSKIKSTQWKEWCKTGWNKTHEGKIGRGFKEEMEKQNNALAVHKEYG